MDSAEKNMNLKKGDIINGKKRGDILFYSLSQVANLLEQEESNVLYFTNVFDDILNIKISDKELKYTDSDINKLEFLINLKNKGMTIKEIQKYCEELSFDDEELIGIKESNPTSVNEIVESISKFGNEQTDNLKEYINNKIDENNEVLVEKIVKLVGEEQKKQLKIFKDDIVNEIKEYIDSKLNIEIKIDEPIYEKISTKIDDFIGEKLLLEDSIKSQIDKVNEMSIARDRDLMDEIKKFRTVIEQAYYVQQEMDKSKEKVGIFSKIFPVNN